jgi:O-antigen/teichoic acid export membrane protein
MIFKNDISKLLFKVVLNNGFNMILTFLYYTFISVFMLKEGYGTFFYNITVITVATMLAELGINIALQKTANLSKNLKELNSYFYSAFLLKFFLSIIVTTVIYLLNFIDHEYFLIFCFGISVSLLYNHIITYCQVINQEKKYLNLLIIGGVIRILVLAVLWYFGINDISILILCFFIVQLLIILLLQKKYAPISYKIDTKFIFNFIKVNKFLNLTTIVVAILVKIEFFILKNFNNEELLDLFSLYFTYTLFIPPLIAAVNSTLIVRINKFKDLSHYISYSRKLVGIISILLFIVYTSIILLLRNILSFTYDDIFNYTLVFIALASTLVVKPWGLLLHYFNKENVVLKINSIQTISALILGFLLLNTYGIFGLIISFAAQQIIANIFIFYSAKNHLKSTRKT